MTRRNNHRLIAAAGLCLASFIVVLLVNNKSGTRDYVEGREAGFRNLPATNPSPDFQRGYRDGRQQAKEEGQKMIDKLNKIHQ